MVFYKFSDCFLNHIYGIISLFSFSGKRVSLKIRYIRIMTEETRACRIRLKNSTFVDNIRCVFKYLSNEFKKKNFYFQLSTIKILRFLKYKSPNTFQFLATRNNTQHFESVSPI